MSNNQNNNDVVILELDRPRELKYGFGPLKKMLSTEGMDLDQLSQGNFDMSKIETFIYFGLLIDAKKNNETLTLEIVEDLLFECHFGELLNKFMDALSIGLAGLTDVEGNALAAQQAKKQKK